MSYTVSISLILGSSQIGLDLVCQLFDTSGTDYGSPISSGFAEIGLGYYLWTGDVPSGFRGGLKVYPNGSISNILTIVAINPEEIENVYQLTEIVTTSPKEISIEVPHVAATGTTIDVVSGSSETSRSIEIKTGIR